MSMNSHHAAQSPLPADSPRSPRLKREVAEYQKPDMRRSLMQVATAFGGFLLTCAAMFALLELSYLLVLALAPIAAGFLVRIFIIQHDCGHQAFFRSRPLNDRLGFVCSLLTLTPYASWRRQHAGHHGIWNDLDRRESGADIYSSCLTVEEFLALGFRERWTYRITRHPLVANVLLPPLVFVVLYRFPFDMPKSWTRERRALLLTNLSLLALYTGLGLVLGFGAVAAVMLPVIGIGAIAGVWLFSVQHRGEDIRWEEHHAWHPTAAALESSNYLRLPAILQWFTGNIGFHHVHHLNPGIPNYRLEECHDAVPALREVPQLSLREGLRALRYVLWDERREKMVTFRDALSAPDA